MRRLRSGFTLVELLVVIAIIAMLTSILLPAVGAARMAARQSQCLNNMRQVTTAMVTYASTKNYMPPYASVLKSNNPGNTPVISDFVYSILPMIEETVIRDEIDAILRQPPHALDNDNNGYIDLVSKEFEIQPIKILACPSNPTTSGVFAPNYIANSGHLDLPNPFTNVATAWSDRANGALSFNMDPIVGANTSYRMETHQLPVDYISSNDGTSSTAIVSENTRFNGENGGGWLPRVISSPNDFANQWSSIEAGRTFWWHYSVDTGTGATATTNLPFDSSFQQFPGFGQEVILPTGNQLVIAQQKSSPFSQHNGGFLMGFADGHVTFINNSIDYRVYAKMLTCNGRESALAKRTGVGPGRYYQDTALSITEAAD